MVNYAYNYAQIDPDTNMCIGVHTFTCASSNATLVEIPAYDNVFCFKYYDWDTGKWYYDAEMTQEFVYGE